MLEKYLDGEFMKQLKAETIIDDVNQWAGKVAIDLDTEKEKQHNWIFFIITLSSAIFEFLGASLLDYEGIRHLSLLYVSMALLAANVCIGLWLTKGKIEKIVDTFADEYRFVDDLRAKVLKLPDESDLRGFVFEELKKRKEDHDRKSPPKDKRDYSMDILLYIFYGAIICMIGSFISCH